MAESERFRLFIAVALPESVKMKIESAQAELRRALPEPGVRWTRREQFHLTLKFLGDVDASRIGALEVAIRAACRGFNPLHLRAERIGFFPDLRRPRVVWTGVHDLAERLHPLQAAVDAATRGFTSEPTEERFTGHVTLARIKAVRPPGVEALTRVAAGMAERVFGQWAADEVELVRSALTPQGARHSSLSGFLLAGPGSVSA